MRKVTAKFAKTAEVEKVWAAVAGPAASGSFDFALRAPLRMTHHRQGKMTRHTVGRVNQGS